MQSPSMPPLVENPNARQQYLNQRSHGRASVDGYSRWPGVSQQGTLSPLSQFNPGWQQQQPQKSSYSSSASSTTSSPSTAVVPQQPAGWPGTPYYPNHQQQTPSSPPYRPAGSTTSWNWWQRFTGPSETEYPSDSVSHTGWGRRGDSPSPPPSTDPPSESSSTFAATPYQTLSRHDSSATISSGLSRASSVPPGEGAPHLALSTGRPPQLWRADFKMPRNGLAAILPRKRKSLAYPGRHNSKTALSPYLRFAGTDNTPVYWDLTTLPSTVLFRDLQRPPAQGDFTRFVCEPPMTLMRIFHSRFPWYVDATASANPVGVTFADLFNALYASLRCQIVDADFYNDELDDEERKRIVDAYRRRCGGDTVELSKGIRRVDFLMGRVVFEGLVKGKEGLWEMRTSKPALPNPSGP